MAQQIVRNNNELNNSQRAAYQQVRENAQPTGLDQTRSAAVVNQSMSIKQAQDDIRRQMAYREPGFKPLIKSTNDFYQSQAAYFSLRDVAPVQAYLVGLPSTEDERLAHIRQLWDAFHSTDAAQDADGQCQKFLSTQTPYEIQRVLWKLQLRSEAAQRGQYHQTSYSTTKPSVYESFSARFADLIKCLTTFKSFCKNLFDDEILMSEKLALSPARELSRKAVNNRTNKRKAKQIVFSVGNMSEDALPEELRTKKSRLSASKPASSRASAGGIDHSLPDPGSHNGVDSQGVAGPQNIANFQELDGPHDPSGPQDFVDKSLGRFVQGHGQADIPQFPAPQDFVGSQSFANPQNPLGPQGFVRPQNFPGPQDISGSKDLFDEPYHRLVQGYGRAATPQFPAPQDFVGPQSFANLPNPLGPQDFAPPHDFLSPQDLSGHENFVNEPHNRLIQGHRRAAPSEFPVPQGFVVPQDLAGPQNFGGF